MSQLSLSLPATPLPKMPSEPIMRSAQIDGDYRWTATRGWAKGKTILWALLNPSVADGTRDDPTMQRMIGFSFRWGFGSMVVVNVYPFISSTTDRLRAWRKTFDPKSYDSYDRQWPEDKSSWSAFHRNQVAISKLLDPISVCVAAWGAGVDDADLEHFLRGIKFPVEDEEFGLIHIEPTWMCLGKTADGSPIHPLARGKHRVPDDAVLKVWKRPGDLHSRAKRSRSVYP